MRIHGLSDYAKRLIMGISDALRGTQYHLQVLPQNIDQAPIDPVRYIVDTAAADGLILTHSEPQDLRVKMLLERDFPFITFGRTELATPHPYIDTDNFDFAYRAAQALLARGRKRIVIVLPPKQFTYSGHQQAGYRRAVGVVEPAPIGLGQARAGVRDDDRFAHEGALPVKR